MAADNACSITGSIQKDQQELKEFLGSAYNDYNLVIALEMGIP